MAQDINIDINIVAKKALTGIKNIQRSTASLSKSFSTMKTSVIAANQALQLATSIGRGVINSVSAIVDAAAEQEKAEKLLIAALKQKGIYTKAAAKANFEMAASLQKVTTFGDEQIIQLQTTLTQFGIEQKVIGDVTKATLDLAAAKGIDLRTAGELVSKSVGSSTNAMSRYGIAVEGAAGSTERALSAVENIAKIYGGSAAAETKTFSGATEQLSNNFGDLLEQIGFFITKSPLVQSALVGISNGFQTLANWLGDVNDTSTEKLKSDLATLREEIEKLKIQAEPGETTFISSFFGGDAEAEIAKALLDELLLKEIELKEQLEEMSADETRTNNEVAQSEKRKKIADKEAKDKVEAERRSVANVLKIDFEAAKKRENFDKLSGKQKVANFQSTMGQIATLSDSNNKALAIAGKAAAMSQATISGILAVQIALASAPPPYNFILAGLVGVAAAANVAKIAGVNAFADGGIVGGSSTVGDRVPVNVNSGELILNQAQQDNLAGGGIGTTVNVTIQGNVIGDEENIQDLAEQLSDAIEFRNVRLLASEVAA